MAQAGFELAPSVSVGLNSSIGRASDWYPEGASSNPAWADNFYRWPHSIGLSCSYVAVRMIQIDTLYTILHLDLHYFEPAADLPLLLIVYFVKQNFENPQ